MHNLQITPWEGESFHVVYISSYTLQSVNTPSTWKERENRERIGVQKIGEIETSLVLTLAVLMVLLVNTLVATNFDFPVTGVIVPLISSVNQLPPSTD
jgi:hypothetical protein